MSPVQISIILILSMLFIYLLYSFWLTEDSMSGFNISFDYTTKEYRGSVTTKQIESANAKGIYNFRLVESPKQQQSTNALKNIADILYDNPLKPLSSQKFDTFYNNFVSHDKNKLMLSVPYNDLNDPMKWYLEKDKYTSKGTGKTISLISTLTDYHFINRIEFSLMRDQLDYTGEIQYPLSNHLIVALYAEATNQKGTTATATPEVAINNLVTNRIGPCIEFMKNINKRRKLLDPPLEPLDLVFPLEVQPRIYHEKGMTDDPLIFDLANPAVVSRDYPMDLRTTQAYNWWSTSKFHSENPNPSSIQPLLDALTVRGTNNPIEGGKLYIGLSLYPIIWQMYNMKGYNDGRTELNLDIEDYVDLVKKRVESYREHIQTVLGKEDWDLLILEFGWPNSCGSMCRSDGCAEGFETMKPRSTYEDQRKHQCMMWEAFKSLKDIPKYYWTLGTDIRHSMCGNSIQQMKSGPGDDNGWRITDKITGEFIC